MPDQYHVDIAALEVAALSQPEVRQKCYEVASEIADEYRQLVPGSIGASAKAQYAEKGSARVVVTSPLAHLYEFGAPGHLYFGRGKAPLPARGWLRNAAEAVTHMPPKDGGDA